jgi:hypothetical protein
MASTRLFHTLVLSGAALVSMSLLACAGGDGSVDPTDSAQTGQTGEPGEPADTDAGPDATPDASEKKDTGWAPTK